MAFYQRVPNTLLASGRIAMKAPDQVLPALMCFHIHQRQGFPVLAKSRSAEGGSPLPEREVSSLLACFPAAAGGKQENWKALSPTGFYLTDDAFHQTITKIDHFICAWRTYHHGWRVLWKRNTCNSTIRQPQRRTYP